MKSRNILLLVAAAAGLVATIKAPGLVLEGSILISSAMLGIFAVLVVQRRTAPALSSPRLAGLSDHLEQLKRLAVAAKRAPLAALDDVERVRIEPWPEEEVEGPSLGGSSIARQLSDRLAPPADRSVSDGPHASVREKLSEQLREGEDLRRLGQLLKLNLDAYGHRVSKGLACARAGRFDQCVIVLQVANARLRSQVESALEGEVGTLRTEAAFRYR